MIKKDGIINLFLGVMVITLMVMLFYLTRKNYNLLFKSNYAVIETSNLIKDHQKVSNDFKNAIIFISAYKKSGSQAYVATYGKGLWEIGFDMLRLKRLVSNTEKLKLDNLSKQINAEEDWLMRADSNNTELYDLRDRHIKSLIGIQNFFDNEISRLEQQSIVNIKTVQDSLSRLHDWIISLIIFTAIIMFISLTLINKQLGKVKWQNGQLREIAWIQSHKVRAQVVTLLGLGQLFNLEDPTDNENIIVINNMVTTTLKLDEIVQEINAKAAV